MTFGTNENIGENPLLSSKIKDNFNHAPCHSVLMSHVTLMSFVMFMSYAHVVASSCHVSSQSLLCFQFPLSMSNVNETLSEVVPRTTLSESSPRLLTQLHLTINVKNKQQVETVYKNLLICYQGSHKLLSM